MQRVRDAVREQRLDARPGREHLGRADAERRGVALARGGDVAADLARDARQRARARAICQRALERARALTAAKNGVEM